VVCAATLAADGLRRRTGAADVVALGAAAGLVALTKSTGLMGLAAVLLLWGLAQLRLGHRRFNDVLGTGTAALTIVAVALVLYGPFMLRMQATFGSPLGPPDYNAGLSMQRHDPAALLVNGLRMASSTVVIPAPAVNAAVARGVEAVSRALRIDPQDKEITLASATYPDPRWKPDEDHAPFPVQSLLVLGALGVSLGLRRVPGAVRAYGAAVLLGLVLTVAIVKWQLWGNRLLLSGLGLAVPPAGFWLERLVRHRRRVGAAVLGLVLVLAFAGGYASVLFGIPRRLVGTDSVFTQTEWQQRFARQPWRRASYQAAADEVRASGATDIGLVLRGDQWEYPLWKLLPGRRFEAMESAVPGHPAVTSAAVGAVVCVAPADLCHSKVPPAWHYHQIDNLVAVAVPG
jgi:hypothetical protein